MLKLNKLFFYTDHDAFINEIEPLKNQRDFLMQCKKDISSYLSPRIKEASVRLLGMSRAVEPRFRTQGSWSYKTCVQPAFNPPQEMDLDFGVYLPVSIWVENGPPHKMAKLYFELVEKLLVDLCKEKNWRLLTGNKRKDTCIRIQVASWAHIDIPLYAAPEHKFLQVVEKAALNASFRAVCDSADTDLVTGELSEKEWEDLDDIHMATRTGEWWPSDPEDVARWYNDRAEQFGPQLRRISRYAKAWRDYQWKNGGGPSSVFIMIAIAQKFEVYSGRDDLALEASMLVLSRALLNDLYEPAIDDGKESFNRLDNNERAIASQKAKEFFDAIKMARSYGQTLKRFAITDLQKHLGSRVPNQEDWIDVDNGSDNVRTTPAIKVPPPLVTATDAG